MRPELSPSERSASKKLSRDALATVDSRCSNFAWPTALRSNGSWTKWCAAAAKDSCCILADALYVTGRSDVLIKLKPLQDTEAVVIEHVPGKGKYQGMMGALRVRTPEGKLFLMALVYG